MSPKNITLLALLPLTLSSSWDRDTIIYIAKATAGVSVATCAGLMASHLYWSHKSDVLYDWHDRAVNVKNHFIQDWAEFDAIKKLNQ